MAKILLDHADGQYSTRLLSAENDGDYTCIFPQPGCDIDALESAEWRASAADLLKKYNIERGKEGSRYQGCCCGHTHRSISAQAAEKLRAAGFLVENDVDPEEGA